MRMSPGWCESVTRIVRQLGSSDDEHQTNNRRSAANRDARRDVGRGCSASGGYSSADFRNHEQAYGGPGRSRRARYQRVAGLSAGQSFPASSPDPVAGLEQAGAAARHPCPIAGGRTADRGCDRDGVQAARAAQRGTAAARYPSDLRSGRLGSTLAQSDRGPDLGAVAQGHRQGERRRKDRAATLRAGQAGVAATHAAGHRADRSHEVDIQLVDDLARAVLGRPWLTLLLDVHSRCVLGLSVSFDPPSAAGVALALAQGVLPKTEWLADRGLDLTWPTHGLPRLLHLDNGREFHSRALRRGCQQHGLGLDYRPPATPRFGGHIERLMGTLMQRVHALPGSTASSRAGPGPAATAVCCPGNGTRRLRPERRGVGADRTVEPVLMRPVEVESEG